MPASGLGGVLVCVPAFNEADSLPGVLAEIPATVAGLRTHVLVIDDGSRDGTAAVARNLGARVVSHPVNSGQGAALQTGYLVAERLGVDVVVTLDADGQHDPTQMERLVEPIVADRADFVVGSRRMGEAEGGGDSRARDAGITVYTRLINLLGGTQVSDIANGYRAIRASRLAEIAFTEDQFHNPELLLGCGAGGPARPGRPGDDPAPDRRDLEEGDQRPLRDRVPAGDGQDLAALRGCGLTF